MPSSWGCPEPLTRAGSGASHSRVSATAGEGPCATTAPGGPSLPGHGTKAEEIWWGWLLSTIGEGATASAFTLSLTNVHILHAILP